MPSIPVYIRKYNYEKLRRHAKATGKSIGMIINELIEKMNPEENTARAHTNFLGRA